MMDTALLTALLTHGLDNRSYLGGGDLFRDGTEFWALCVPSRSSGDRWKPEKSVDLSTAGSVLSRY
jgi:hypothetical protein